MVFLPIQQHLALDSQSLEKNGGKRKLEDNWRRKKQENYNKP